MGLLCNPASVNGGFVHARKLIDRKFPGRLTALFSPQHGFFSDKQDNMIESGNLTDPLLGIPVFSLYGETRIPTREMFESHRSSSHRPSGCGDKGLHLYLHHVLLHGSSQSLREEGGGFRPPQPGGRNSVEGNLLSPSLASFVGRYPIPMRHGLTIGELARLFNEEFHIGCDLTVIPMKGWERSMYFGDTGLPWIAPSPNLPTPASALVYPGQVILEGTNISEGRGTALPFEQFGAPYISPQEVLSFLGESPLPGAILRPVGFEPTSNKWGGKLCRGFQIHVTDPGSYNAFGASLRLLQAVIACHGDSFAFKSPPYEYDFTHLPMDLILGDESVRKGLLTLTPVERMEASWEEDLSAFEKLRENVLLYSIVKKRCFKDTTGRFPGCRPPGKRQGATPGIPSFPYPGVFAGFRRAFPDRRKVPR